MRSQGTPTRGTAARAVCGTLYAATILLQASDPIGLDIAWYLPYSQGRGPAARGGVEVSAPRETEADNAAKGRGERSAPPSEGGVVVMSSTEMVIRFILAAVAGYLLGSLPSGVIVARLFGHVDPRTQGSGKTGTTNILRTLGPGPAGLVALLDALKGIAAVLLVRFLIFPTSIALPVTGIDIQGWAEALAGAAAVVGHNYSIFIRFTGGRGVMTGAAVSLAMSPITFVCGILGFLLPVVLTRYVSLGSIIGSAVTFIAGFIFMQFGIVSKPHELCFFAVGMFIILSHRDNIERLLRGTERKLGQPAEPIEREKSQTPR